MLNEQSRRGRLRPRTHLWLLLACFVLSGLTVACGPQITEEASAEELEEARPLFLQNCARCHQAGGEGYRGVYPALNENPLVTLEDPQPMLEIILDGRGGMPGFRGSLTDAEIAQIASYVRGAWENDARAITTTEVR